ncbi:MAG: two-component system, sensor histidine kinase and response regulator [Actinomycetota bacterium]|nr:two-component system, sensor histidine kinase and response regulator [Actinomycetota bacterium]
MSVWELQSRDKWARRSAIAMALLALPAIFDYSKSTIIDPGWLYPLCGVIGSLGIVIGVRIHRPPRALAWYLLAAGNLMFVTGDVIYWRLDAGGPVPFPALNDVVYLAAYPFLAAGLAGLIGGSRRTRGSFIDASIIATSAGLVAWVFLMEPYATDQSLTMVQRLASIAYPIADLLLLATVCWFLLSEGRRNMSLTWLLVSIGSLLIFDTIYGVRVLQGTYTTGVLDGGFIISYLAFGAAALDPSMKTLVPKKNADRSTISRRQLVLLAGAAILGPGLLGMTILGGAEVNPWVMTMGTLVLFLLAFLRIAGLVRSLERTASLLEVQGLELETAVDELKNLEAGRRHLLDAVQTAAELERSLLALELHDGPIQRLTTLSFEVDLAAVGLEEHVLTRTALFALETGLSAEIESLRVLMTDLRPPVLDERGLTLALGDLLASFMTRTMIVCELDLDIEVRLNRGIETLLYRTAQEALTNVAKHSKASRVVVRCAARDGEVQLEISDDGVGFDASTMDMSGMDGHLGLASIKERIEFVGGRCFVDAAIGRGTRVRVSLTLERISGAEATALAG